MTVALAAGDRAGRDERRRRQQGLGRAAAGDPGPARRGRHRASPISMRSPSAAARAPSPACAPPARWRRAWPSAPASRCCRSTACSIVAEAARAGAATFRTWARDRRAHGPDLRRRVPLRRRPLDDARGADAGRLRRARAALARGAARGRRRRRAAGVRRPPRHRRGAALSPRRAPTPRRCSRLALAAWRDGAGVDPAEALPLYVRDKVAQTDARARSRARRRAAAPTSAPAGRSEALLPRGTAQARGAYEREPAAAGALDRRPQPSGR